MKRVGAVVGAGITLWLLAGCARPHPPSTLPVATTLPKTPDALPAPVPLLPDQAELAQELSIVASPQLSLERSQSAAGHVKDLHGGWVRYGPVHVTLGRPSIRKTGRADIPFTASIVVTHAQPYSDVTATKAQAVHALLPFTQEQMTTYRYEYRLPSGQSGVWVYKDALGGALIDKGRQ